MLFMTQMEDNRTPLMHQQRGYECGQCIIVAMSKVVRKNVQIPGIELLAS